MVWKQFLIVLASCYALYYALNIFFDLFTHPRSAPGDQGSEDLVFQEPNSPTLVPVRAPEAKSSPSPAPAVQSGELLSNGGCSIGELQRLAREELIEYTKTLAF